MKIRFNKKHKELTLTRELNGPNALHTLTLRAEDTTQLIRFCADLAASGKTKLAATGVQVVTASLAYSDFGDGDQDTPAYNWAVVLPNRKFAEEVRRAAAKEVAMAGFGDAKVHIPAVPEIGFDVKAKIVMQGLAEALTDLRIALFMHQSDSVADRIKYWLALGFSEEEADEIKAVVGDYRTFMRDEFDPAEFMAHCREHCGEMVAMFERLQRWIDGKSVQQIKQAVKTL